MTASPTIVHLTPGAGRMYCGGCFRDNALVGALRRRGLDTLLVPLYLPLTLEEENQSAGTPVFFSGLNVYLGQRYAWFRRAPQALHRLLSHPTLLRWVGRAAAKTRPEEVGDLTLSMLRGETGNQNRQITELIDWLKTHTRPRLLCLSNALLLGMARRLRAELGVPIVCTFQGEDGFLDALPESHREPTWELLRQRAADADLFLAPSRYGAELMRSRLRLPLARVRVIYNGIPLAGYHPAEAPPPHPTLGYFARLCPEKGLDTLVEAFLHLKRRARVPDLKLRVGGSLGPADVPLVEKLKDRLRQQQVLGDVEFHPNIDRAAKQAFYRSLSVLSVPVPTGEIFGLYLIEALACGVPVVQPRHGAFPELLEATHGGVLFEPYESAALAEALEPLLRDPARSRALGQTAAAQVRQRFDIDRMAEEVAAVYDELTGRQGARPQS